MYTILAYIHYFLTELSHYFRRHPSPRILHASANYLLVDKPPDMRINSNDPSHKTLQTYLSSTYPQHINRKLVHEFYFVHRLDYATSGLICIPLTKTACARVATIFQSRRTEKFYVAIVRGILSSRLIVQTDAIGDVDDDGAVQRMCTAREVGCRRARTATTLLLALEDGVCEAYAATKVLIRPITGRRHQIRVHCAALGHTIVGDYTYSRRKDVAPTRMYLHSLRLVLPDEVESVDLQTGDPFDERALAGRWTVFNKFSTLEDGYAILRRYADELTTCNTRKTHLPM